MVQKSVLNAEKSKTMKKDNKINESLIGFGIVIVWFTLMFVIAQYVV
jgi:hypothetical protein